MNHGNSKNVYLEQVVIGHMCGQPSQTLPSAATNTNQQTVTTRLFDYTGDTRHVLNGKPAKHTWCVINKRSHKSKKLPQPQKA